MQQKQSVWVVAIDSTGRILYGREPKHKRQWSLPGGKRDVRDNGDLMTAAAREFAEEVLGKPRLPSSMQAHFNKYARLLETPQIAQGNHYVQWLFGANVSLSKIPTASKVMEEIAFRDRAELQSVAASEPKTVRWPTLMFATKYLREQPLAQPLGERFKWQERCKEERKPIECHNKWEVRGVQALLSCNPTWLRRKRTDCPLTHKDTVLRTLAAIKQDGPIITEEYSQAKTNSGMRIGRLKIQVVDHAQTTPHANLKSELRECVTGAAVADLDMQSCHSCILLELISDLFGCSDDDCRLLWDMGTRREFWLAEVAQLYGCTRGTAKSLLFKCMYASKGNLHTNGRLEAWAKAQRLEPTVDDDDDRVQRLRSAVDAYGPAMQRVRRRILDHYGDAYERVARCDRNNQEGSAFSLLIQSIECELLYLLVDHAKKSGAIVHTLMWDGAYLRIPYNHVKAHICSLNAYVKRQTGWTRIVFARKELSLPTPFNTYAMTGPEATAKWLDYMARDFTNNHTRFVRCAHGSTACVVDTTARAYGFDGTPKMPAWFSQEEFKRHHCHRMCGAWVDPQPDSGSSSDDDDDDDAPKPARPNIDYSKIVYDTSRKTTSLAVHVLHSHDTRLCATAWSSIRAAFPVSSATSRRMGTSCSICGADSRCARARGRGRASSSCCAKTFAPGARTSTPI
jgi:8-oxo-dGTP pyrophosphatase MutT (NUDIX family)